MPLEFYSRPTLDVARDLIGHMIVVSKPDQLRSGRIVEVEAYLQDDPACHAYGGKTRRNSAMFGPPGHAYVYLIYGVHWCLNVVTGNPGIGEAVLIRSIEPMGDPTMDASSKQASGPGRVCRFLGVTGEDNHVSLLGPDMLILKQRNVTPLVRTSTRIGITKNADRLWRFIDSDSKALSGSKRLNESAI